jgi:hypothetical protein
MLVFDVVLGLAPGLVAGAVALVGVFVAWLALPLGVRRRHPHG